MNPTSFSIGGSPRTTDHGQATGKLCHLGCESSVPLFVIYQVNKQDCIY